MALFGKDFKKALLFLAVQFSLFLVVAILVKSWFLDSLTVLSRKWLNHVRITANTDFKNQLLATAKSKIAVVWIDPKFFEKESISIQGLHRGYYAKVLEEILKDNPTAVMVDVLFEKKFRFGSGEDAQQLREIFEKYDQKLASVIDDRVVLWAVYDFRQKKLIKPEQSILGSWWIGHVKSFRWWNSDVAVGVYDILPPDGGILPLFVQGWLVAQKKLFEYAAKGKVDVDMSYYKDGKFLKFGFNPKLKIPLSSYEYTTYLPVPIYFANIQSSAVNYYSLWDVYYNGWDFEGKAVFLGAVDPALNDMELTLKWEIPGVGVHVNGFLSLLLKDYVYLLSPDEIILVILLLFVINFLAVLASKKNVVVLGVLFGVELFLLFIASFVFASYGFKPNIWLPFLTFLVALIFYFLGSWLYISWEKELLADFMRSMLRVYVGEKISGKIKSNYLKPEAQIVKVAVLFADMEGFSTKVEKWWAAKTVSVLNRYLTVFADAIQKFGGKVDKFIGDAVMAFWEGKEWPQNAARAAVEAILGVKKLSKELLPVLGMPLNARVGLSWGDAILGDIGSKDRLDYTIIGDNVNVAARLESINKVYWTNIAASENFVKGLIDPEEFLIRWIDITKVKGKEELIKIYEILPVKVENLDPQKLQKLKEYIKKFEEAVEAFHHNDLKKAKEIFLELTKIWPEDKVVKFYLARIAGLEI